MSWKNCNFGKKTFRKNDTKSVRNNIAVESELDQLIRQENEEFHIYQEKERIRTKRIDCVPEKVVVNLQFSAVDLLDGYQFLEPKLISKIDEVRERNCSITDLVRHKIWKMRDKLHEFEDLLGRMNENDLQVEDVYEEMKKRTRIAVTVAELRVRNEFASQLRLVEDASCPICQETYLGKRRAVIEDCMHIYCLDCLMTIIPNGTRCPQCNGWIEGWSEIY